MPERATPRRRSEKSAEAVVAEQKLVRAESPRRSEGFGEAKGRTEGERDDRESQKGQAPDVQAIGAPAGGRG